MARMADLKRGLLLGSCLGLMLVVVVDRESFPVPDPMVGGLLVLALLHHLPGLVLVLPVVLAWLVLNRSPFARMFRFLRANPILLLVVAMFLMTIAFPPPMFWQRVQDVSTGSDGGASALVEKVHRNWMFLTTRFPKEIYRSFLVGRPKQWFLLLDVSSLGGFVLPVVGAMWIFSTLAFPGRKLRYIVHLLLLAGMLVGLSVMQHLVTDFCSYRDFTLIIALMVAGLVFVLRASRLSGIRAVMTWTFIVFVSLYNFVDLHSLRGRTYGAPDYAPRSQAVLESVLSEI